ncbi:MAG: bacillithiol biosynthesis cysteine-adding enzyme BshC [Bacteroidota bacterium]
MIDSIATLPFQKTGYFTKIINDYLDEKKAITPFYDQFPNIKGFEKQIQYKRESFSKGSRIVLATQLKKQYKNIEATKSTRQNLELLLKENTFTVTTGHQLNLFTGPLYFLYKIITAINLTKQLKKSFPDDNFIPVYWMATEDHDFEEIQFFNYKNSKIKWQRDSKGAVGELSTDGLEKVFKEFSSLLGKGTNAKYLEHLFQQSYLKHDNLTDATRYLANELFGDYGLVIIDGNDKILKTEFAPYVKEELLYQTSFKEITKTNSLLKEHYKIQVNPREINLFYLKENLRERIIYEGNSYRINNTDLKFSKEEILKELDISPERFSPNVLTRPLYEEVILPNLCYIGGGGELAYWFELKSYFEKVNIPFPILLLRNSVLLINKKENKKLNKLEVSLDEIFLKQNDFINKKVREYSDIEIDFTQQKIQLKEIFKEIELISHCTDRSFLGAVKAQEKKQLNGMDHLEKRLLKAQKRKLQEIVDRISVLHNELFPNEGLQERVANFSEFYKTNGKDLIIKLVDHLDPLKLEFTVLQMDH